MKFLQVFLISSTIVGAFWLIWQIYDLIRGGRGRAKPKRIPHTWPLNKRAVLNAQERHVYALMKQAFPGHEILVKLPLTRFTQLRDTKEAVFWYELLSPLTVTFTLCDANTQVFAVIDMLNEGRAISSATRLKQRALEAAQIRYAQLDTGRMPNARQLRDLILSEKEQRDSLWKTSSGIHGTTPAPSSAPSPVTRAAERGPDSKQPLFSEALMDQKAQLQKRVQEQRDIRKQLLRSDPTRVDLVLDDQDSPSTLGGSTLVSPRHDMRDFRDSRTDSKLRRYNPETIRGRDSFLTPDSRSIENYRFREGAVTPYTTKESIAAEHVWLDSKATSQEDKGK